MTEAEHYFFAECARRARELPLARSVQFLRGCLLASPAALETDLQKIFVAVSQSDRQLELIQTGRLRLHLAQTPPPCGGQFPGHAP